MAHRPRPEHPIVKALEQPADRYRWLVGEFVLRMADVEYLVADAVGAVLGEEHSRAKRAWAGSGTQLVEALGFAEERAPELEAVRVEYDDLATHRNTLVHGMYDGYQVSVDGQILHGTTKPDRWKAASPSHPFTQDSRSEQDIWGWVVRAETLAAAALDVIGTHRHD